jgi:hypothetical protein
MTTSTTPLQSLAGYGLPYWLDLPRPRYPVLGQREEYADIINADYSKDKVEEPQAPQEPEAPKLEKMNRTDLEKMASDLGIGAPDQFPNKDALIAEIRKYQ